MLQALDTWLGPNQTAASFAGNERMNTCDVATMAWPMNATQNKCGSIASTLIQAPKHVPKQPHNAATRSPWKKKLWINLNSIQYIIP